MVATPYAAGLSTLVDDEAELGAAVVDFGGGTTTVGVFSGGRLIHVDAVAVGGIHVTRDIARGLNVSMTRRRAPEDALRRLPRLAVGRSRVDRRPPARRRHGSSEPSAEIRAAADHPPARGGDPRTRARPAQGVGSRRASGPPRGDDRGRLPVDRDCRSSARTIISSQARIGRPLGIEGLPESGKSPSFAAAVGLMVYPQMAGLEYFEPTRHVVAPGA